MAIQLEKHVNRYRGLSTDQKPGRFRGPDGNKPSGIPVGSVFTETDTGKRFVWTVSKEWARQEQTVETLLGDLVDINSKILDELKITRAGHQEFSWGDELDVENIA